MRTEESTVDVHVVRNSSNSAKARLRDVRVKCIFNFMIDARLKIVI